MSILLLHISDIHFGSGKIPKAADRLLAAIRGINPEPSCISILLTGDVAFSGKMDEYELANKYLSDLNQSLIKEFDVPCEIVVCPGNHDCSFPDDTTVRDVVIQDIRSKRTVPESKEAIQQCNKVQDPFFRWLRCFDPNINIPNHRFAWTKIFENHEGIKIGFRVLNTAWMSTIREDQGNLLYPVSKIPELSNVDVSISLLHHPYNWFESSNSRELRKILEGCSDLILTGHEHDYDEYRKTKKPNDISNIGYIEAGLFCNDSEENISFSVIQIDLSKSEYLVHPFHWKKNLFTSNSNELSTHSFIFMNSSIPDKNILSNEMRQFLEKPGFQFTHHAKSVSLEDIYVPPDLKTYGYLEKIEQIENGTIPSDEVINKIFTDHFVFILGDVQSGKTAFSKILFINSIRGGLTPIYLDGRSVRVSDISSLKNDIEKKVKEQYSNLSLEEFWQKPIEEKVIIVDGFNHSKINTKGRTTIVNWFKKRFGYIFLFGGELTQVEDLVLLDDQNNSLPGFMRYEIKQFGHFLRDKLLKKWITLGREYTISQEELDQKLRETAHTLNTILGKHLIPANPAYILLLLQQLEAATPHNISSGSYGYFYEAILTLAFQQVSNTPEEIDEKYTYLSELAWAMFKKGVDEFDNEELNKFTDSHCDTYRSDKEPRELLSEIISAHLLQEFYGKFRFFCSYFYYYFIARYMHDNIKEDYVQAQIAEASQEIHREDMANILIFYTYLTKDKRVIKLVINNSKKLFHDVDPCNLSGHIAFVNRLHEEFPRVFLSEVDPAIERESMLKKRDQEEEKEALETSSKSGNQEEKYDEEIELLLSTNRAVKTLQVLGQILRNFRGSIKNNLKIEITKECFNLALRVLNSFYHSLERNLDIVIPVFTDQFGEDFADMNEEQKAKIANKLVFYISEMMCLSTLNRISNAVGSEKLIKTYQDVEDSYDTRATRFVQLSLRLDHISSFPRQRILDLHKEVKSDVFGLTLLRILVVNHFHMFPRSYKIRQSICKKLDIPYRKTIRLPKTSG